MLITQRLTVLSLQLCALSLTAGLAHAQELAFIQRLDNDLAIERASGVVVSPDGLFTYITSGKATSTTETRIDSIMVYARSPNGTLTQIARYVDGQDGIDGLVGSRKMAISPDGNHLYLTAYLGDAIFTFNRNQMTGLLSFAQKITSLVGNPDNLPTNALFRPEEVAVSPDGTSVYVAAAFGDGVSWFSRNPATGLLTYQNFYQPLSGSTRLLDVCRSVIVSPDGAHVYATNGSTTNSGSGSNRTFRPGIGRFLRNQTTGALTFQGMFTDNDPSTPAGMAMAAAIDPYSIDPVTGVRYHRFLRCEGVRINAAGNRIVVYGGTSNAVNSLARDNNPASPTFGQLTYISSVVGSTTVGVATPNMVAQQAMAFTPDGSAAFCLTTTATTGWNSKAVTAFALDSAGVLSVTSQYTGPEVAASLGGFMALSPLNDSLYVATDTATAGVAILSPDPMNGLTYVGSEVSTPRGLAGANGLALSPDGAHVYVAGPSNRSIVRFDRNAATGLLSFVERYEDDLAGTFGIASAEGIVMDPAGLALYIPSSAPQNSLSVHLRNNDPLSPGFGTLSFNKKMVEGTIDPDSGTTVRGLANVRHLAVMPNGNHVHTMNYTDTSFTLWVGLFNRNPVTGTLSHFFNFSISSFGGNPGVESLVYQMETTGPFSNAAQLFAGVSRVDGADGGVSSSEVSPGGQPFDFLLRQHNTTSNSIQMQLQGIRGLAVSPDQQHLYAVAGTSNSLVVFDAILFPPFIPIQQLIDGQNGVDGLSSAFWVDVSKDGRLVFVTARTDNSIAVFTRNTDPLSPQFGQVRFRQVLKNGVGGVSGLSNALRVAVSPDDRFVYTTAAGSAAVAAFQRREPADFNWDNSVDSADLAILLAERGDFDPIPLSADMDNNGQANDDDLDQFLPRFGL